MIASRRRFLALGATGLAGWLAPAGSWAAGSGARALAFHNVHTGEFVRATYWAAGRHVREGLSQIDHVLRDHRTNLVHPIDRRLLGLLDALRDRLDVAGPFEVISGYRSPATNAMPGSTFPLTPSDRAMDRPSAAGRLPDASPRPGPASSG